MNLCWLKKFDPKSGAFISLDTTSYKIPISAYEDYRLTDSSTSLFNAAYAQPNKYSFSSRGGVGTAFGSTYNPANPRLTLPYTKTSRYFSSSGDVRTVGSTGFNTGTSRSTIVGPSRAYSYSSYSSTNPGATFGDLQSLIGDDVHWTNGTPRILHVYAFEFQHARSLHTEAKID